MWTSPARADIAAALLDVMGASVHPLGIGGPRSAEVDALGKRLDCPAGDDLRKMLIERPAAFVLVTSLQEANTADLRSAANEGTRILTLEPFVADLEDLPQDRSPAGNGGAGGSIAFAPAFTQCPGYLGAADPQDQLGDTRQVRFTSLGRPEHGSLFARLLDAWVTILNFSPLPEQIDASLTGANDSPRKIAGRLAAHARVADGGAVLLELADTAGQTRRSLSVLGDDAQLTVLDTQYSLARLDGTVIDQSPDAASPTPPTFIDQLAHQWRRLLDRPAPPLPSPTLADALACAHACLLSARTGQPESPAKLLKISR